MKILTMIPARMGSNRIKKKNLRILGDIPLIEHIIRSAKDSYYTSEIFINSVSVSLTCYVISSNGCSRTINSYE